MRCTFQVTGFIVRFKPIKNGRGLSICVMEAAPNQLGKPNFTWVAVWDKKAEAIKAKLAKGKRFEFSGEITTRSKGGKQYTNYTVDRWKEIPKPARRPWQARSEGDDDWFVPEPVDRDRPSARLAEGFDGRLR